MSAGLQGEGAPVNAVHGHTQVVRPAGAGHETLWVALAAACVLAVAALVIGVRSQPLAEAALAPHQIDARTQLNAAEQGVHADLLVAAEEITALLAEDKVLPSIEHLRGMDLPPFATGLGAASRGGHVWSTTIHGHDVAYLGRSTAPELAASFLLRLPVTVAEASPPGHAHDDAPEVWVHREGLQVLQDRFDDASLSRQGWRQVVTRYDAGVTRTDTAR